jgi:hypothetical protein
MSMSFGYGPAGDQQEMISLIGQFLCELAEGVDRKSTGSNFGCVLRCEFSCQSFSQSASDGTVTSACFKQA